MRHWITSFLLLTMVRWTMGRPGSSAVRDRCAGLRRRGAMLGAMAAIAAPAAASGLPDMLLTATVRADAPGRADPRPALRRALGIALARLSGNPAMEERVGDRDPGPLVLDLSYEDVLLDKPLNDEQGTRDRPFLLTVRFDGEALLRLLEALGERPWLAPRPRLAPMLALRSRDGRDARLTGDDPLVDRPRAALTAAGMRYAVPIALPGLAAPGVPRGAVAVAGRLDWVEGEFGWRGAFALRGDGWGVSGAGLDEAFRVLVGGAAVRLRG